MDMGSEVIPIEIKSGQTMKDVFVKDSGYETIKKHCSGEGLKRLRRKGIKQPLFWNGRKWRCPSSPVVGVSWYEAEAFAKWLNTKQSDNV